MGDAGGMSRVERVGDLSHELEGAIEFQPLAFERRSESLARNQLHRDVEHRRTDGRTVSLRRALPDVVNGDEMRVIQRRRRPRLEHEALEAIRVTRHILAKDLESQVTAEHGVLGKIDLAHAAAGDEPGDVETSNRRIRQVFVGHGRSRYLTRTDARSRAARILPRPDLAIMEACPRRSPYLRWRSRRSSRSPSRPRPRKDRTRTNLTESVNRSRCSTR